MEEKKEKKENWYFTFTQSSDRRDFYIKIFGTFSEARKIMFDKYGSQWAFQYNEEEKKEAIDRFNLKELKW